MSNTENSGLTITLFNFTDYLLNGFNSLGSTITVLITLAGFIGGGLGWFLRRTTIKTKATSKDKK